MRACPLRDTAVNGLHCGSGSCNKCITFNDSPPYTYMLTVQPVAHHMLTVHPVAHHMQRCGAILPCHQFFVMCHNTYYTLVLGKGTTKPCNFTVYQWCSWCEFHHSNQPGPMPHPLIDFGTFRFLCLLCSRLCS